MDELFNPKSIVVLGVSEREKNIGQVIIKNLLDFNYEGNVFPVGPKGGTIFGKKIYQTVAEVPSNIDFAVIFVPAAAIPAAIKECVQKGIKRGLIMTAGFSEYSEEGTVLEKEILKLCKQSGFRFVGPNCIGLYNTRNNMFLSFGWCNPEDFLAGNVSILSQSGGLGNLYAWHLAGEKIGLSKFVSMGNKLTIDEVDLLTYLKNDQETEIIFIYLEGIERGRELFDLAIECNKPIIIHKANVSSLSSEIAKSHTAALVSDDRIVTIAFKQAGIIRINRLTQLIDCAKILSLPPIRGNRLAIISSTGGTAVSATDACAEYEFELPALPPDLFEYIEKHVRAGIIKLTNPVDLGDIFDLNVIYNTIAKVIELPFIDGVVVCLFYLSTAPGWSEGIIDLVAKIKELPFKLNKPLVINILASAKDYQKIKEKVDYPIFLTFAEVIEAMALVRDSIQRKEKKTEPAGHFPFEEHSITNILNEALLAGRNELLLNEAMQVIEKCGIPVNMPRLAKNLEEAVTIAKETGYPLAVKVFSPSISHKSDVGGVILNVSSKMELEKAYWTILENLNQRTPGAKFSGIYLQKMAQLDMEVIIGIKRDDQFGPVILFGMGGKYVEFLEDTSLRLAPITKDEAAEMISEVRGAAILQGVRGEKPFDVLAIIDSLLRLSQLAVQYPAIKEIDVNPLIVNHEGMGVVVVDARMIIE